MQVYRGLPILTAQPKRPTRLVAIWELEHLASLGEYQHLAHEAIDELSPARLRSWWAALGCTFELRSPTSTCLRTAPGARSAGSRSTTTRAASVRTSCSPSSTRKRRQPSIRTTGAESCGHSSWPRAEPAALRAEPPLDGEHDTRPSSSGSTCPEELDRRIEARAREMFAAGARARRSARSRPPSRTRRVTRWAWRSWRASRRRVALEALTRRTKRYASYQRKWMRRIPGLVSLNADRPSGEIADELLQVARARQRLPAGRAG